MHMNTLDRLTRFKSDLSYTEKPLDILVIGLGSIGGRLLRELICMGNFNYYLCELKDHIIDIENIGVQWFDIGSVGLYKWARIKHNMELFGYSNNINFIDKYDENSITCPITFIGTDNITSRKIAFKKWLELLESLSDGYGDDLIPGKEQCIFIDGRLQLWHGQCYVVTSNPKSIERYLESINFEENDVQEPSCTAKMTSPSATMMAALMTTQFSNFLARINTKDDDIDNLFSIKFNGRRNWYESKI